MLTTIEAEIEQRCRVCGEYYPLSHFHAKRDGKYGKATICKDCHRAQASQRYTNEKRERTGINRMMCSYSPEDPWHDLACCVIAQAAEDLKAVKRKGHYKLADCALGQFNTPMDELMTFFKSAWFETLCDLAGHNPEVLRKRILEP